MKQLIKKCLQLFGIYVSSNHRYDALLEKILQKELLPNSNCVDVGCHKGEILDLFLKNAPQGKHIGFEPIPHMAKELKKKYGDIVVIKEVGLSNESGKKDFTHVKNAEAFSGFKPRDYQNRTVDLDTIQVNICTLDNTLAKEHISPIKLIKIDVEGAELEVLEGAEQTIRTDRPIVIFEHGKGAADFYKTQPDQVFDFFAGCQMNIATLTSFLSHKKALSKAEFQAYFENGKEYYFVGY